MQTLAAEKLLVKPNISHWTFKVKVIQILHNMETKRMTLSWLYSATAAWPAAGIQCPPPCCCSRWLRTATPCPHSETWKSPQGRHVRAAGLRQNFNGGSRAVKWRDLTCHLGRRGGSGARERRLWTGRCCRRTDPEWTRRESWERHWAGIRHESCAKNNEDDAVWLCEHGQPVTAQKLDNSAVFEGIMFKTSDQADSSLWDQNLWHAAVYVEYVKNLPAQSQPVCVCVRCVHAGIF